MRIPVSRLKEKVPYLEQQLMVPTGRLHVYDKKGLLYLSCGSCACTMKLLGASGSAASCSEMFQVLTPGAQNSPKWVLPSYLPIYLTIYLSVCLHIYIYMHICTLGPEQAVLVSMAP